MAPACSFSILISSTTREARQWALGQLLYAVALTAQSVDLSPEKPFSQCLMTDLDQNALIFTCWVFFFNFLLREDGAEGQGVGAGARRVFLLKE